MKFFIFSFLYITSTFASFPEIDVKKISGQYLDQKGTAYAEKAYYALPKVKISHENIDIEFSKIEKNLVIKDPSTTVQLEFDFTFLNVFKAFSFENLNIKSDEKLFTIDSEVLDLYIQPKKYHLEQFLIQTDVRNIPTNEGEDISILDGLILNGQLQVNKMTFSDFDIIIFDEIRSENPNLIKEIDTLELQKKINIPMIIRKISFVLDKGDFNGKALVDSYINLWFKLRGNISSNKENTNLLIKIDYAKLGIFSVRSTILKMVKRLNLDKVQVDVSKRLITIDLSSVVARTGSETSSLKSE